jgi:hypothetical protein
MSNGFIEVLGKWETETEVVTLIRDFSLAKVSDSPPSRQYVGAKSQGIDLIVENGRVFCTQIYLKPAQGFSAYAGALPLGICAGMSQDQVHALLGAPVKQDKTYSSFLLDDKRVKLAIDFDSSSEIKLLSFMTIPAR